MNSNYRSTFLIAFLKTASTIFPFNVSMTFPTDSIRNWGYVCAMFEIHVLQISFSTVSWKIISFLNDFSRILERIVQNLHLSMKKALPKLRKVVSAKKKMDVFFLVLQHYKNVSSIQGQNQENCIGALCKN